MLFDELKVDDMQFESEGVVVIMDLVSLVYLNGLYVDFDDGLQGKGFEIKNFNVQSICGCGKLFS